MGVVFSLVGWPVCGVWIDVWWSLVFWFLGSPPTGGEDFYHISCGFVGLLGGLFVGSGFGCLSFARCVG